MRERGYILRPGRMGYGEAWALQRRLQAMRIRGEVPDLLLLLEHPPTYTIGRSGGSGHLLLREEELRAAGFEVVACDRGGDVTYHGPGQLVGYPILDLRRHGSDVHRYLRDLEECLIRAAAGLGVRAERRAGLTGVWAGGRKLASIGVRVVRWVTLHGFALNVNNDLAPFRNIVPCGIRGCTMVSLREILGAPPDPGEVTEAVIASFSDVFRIEPFLRRPEELLETHGPTDAHPGGTAADAPAA